MKLSVLSALLLGAVTQVDAGAKGNAMPSEAAIMRRLDELATKIENLHGSMLEMKQQVRALYESSKRAALVRAEQAPRN